MFIAVYVPYVIYKIPYTCAYVGLSQDSFPANFALLNPDWSCAVPAKGIPPSVFAFPPSFFSTLPRSWKVKVPSAQAKTKIDKRRRKDNFHEDKPHSKRDKGKNNRLLRMTYGKRKSDVR